MTGWLSAAQYVLLTAALFGLGTAVAIRLAWPWLAPRLDCMAPEQRCRWLLALAAAPVMASLTQAAVCALPALVGASWHVFDHGGAHAHGVAEYAAACVSHPPFVAGAWPAWVLTIALLSTFAVPAVRRLARLWRGHRTLRALVLAAVPFRGGSVRVIDVQTPLACAVGRAGTIVISRALADGIEPEALRAVLAHEQAHVRRRDGLWRAVSALFATAHLPVVAAALSARLQLASEQACDEAAAVEVGDRLIVASALLTVERLFERLGRADHPPLPRHAVAFSGGATTARVEALLAPLRHRVAPALGRFYVAATVSAAIAVTHPLQHAAEAAADLLGA